MPKFSVHATAGDMIISNALTTTAIVSNHPLTPARICRARASPPAPIARTTLGTKTMPSTGPAISVNTRWGSM
jgi:hypothetical protein